MTTLPDENWAKAGQFVAADICRAWAYRLREAGVALVALDSLLSAYPDEAVYLEQTANLGVIVYLYRPRGTVDNAPTAAPDSIDGKMAGLKADYDARLADIRSGEALREMQIGIGINDPDDQDPGEVSFVDIDTGRGCSAGDEYGGRN